VTFSEMTASALPRAIMALCVFPRAAIASSCNRGKCAKRQGRCGRAWYSPLLVWAS
jgi:hypothetical protein